MIEQKLEELRYYFTGYGSPHDETILKMIEQNKRYREALEEANRELINLYNNLLDHKVTADEAIENIELIGINIIQDALKGDKQ